MARVGCGPRVCLKGLLEAGRPSLPALRARNAPQPRAKALASWALFAFPRHSLRFLLASLRTDLGQHNEVRRGSSPASH